MLAWLTAVLALALGLGVAGCHPGAPNSETRPCADLHERANAQCERVARACSTVPRCLRALPRLVDPDTHFPSRSACGKTIMARLDQTSVTDMPSLLEAVSSDDARTSLLALGTFHRLAADEVEAALAADSTAEATLALAAIATDAKRESARRVFQARADGRDVVKRFVTKRGFHAEPAWRELAGIPHVEIAPEGVARAALALRPEDDWWTICDVATAEREPDEDDDVRRAFGRLALSARSKAARRCALYGARRRPPPAGSSDYISAYGPEPKTTMPAVACRNATAAPGDPWHFQRGGVQTTVQAPRREAWRPDAQSGPYGGWICFDHPRLRALDVNGVVLTGFEGSGMLVAVRGDEAFPVLAHPAVTVHGTPRGGVVAVASMVHGDDSLFESLVVFSGQGGAELTERVGLPGERFEWSTVEGDGTLLVATSEQDRGRTFRYLSAVGGVSETPVDCWLVS